MIKKLGKLTKPEDVWELSLGQTLSRSAQLCPDKIAFKEGHNNRSCTYAELNQKAEAVAAGLASLGVKKGDRVGIILPNSIEAMISFYGVTKLGAIVVGINPRYRESEIRFMLSNSGASTVISTSKMGDFEFFPLLSQLRQELSDFHHIILTGPPDKNYDNVLFFEEWVMAYLGNQYPDPKINTREDLAILLYTSGTTGVPKGAMLTHYQLIRNSSFAIHTMDIIADDVILFQLPWFHVFALTVCVDGTVIPQATAVILEPYNPREALRLIEENGITVHHGTPAMFLMEMNLPDFKNYNLSSLRTGLAAGAPFAPALLQKIEKEMGIVITSGWGMTEVGGFGCSCQLDDPPEIRAETIGIPIWECEAKVVDEEGRELPRGERGELWFRGWTVLKGYWNNPEETKNQITKDGWLKTGDMAIMDEQGYIRIVGRKKELINRGGYKVYPTELEELLIKHPKVAEVAVVGTPNPILGESICACVIPKGDPPTLTDLREFCKDKIADYKYPDELCIMQDFPRMSSGKVTKFGERGLRARAIKDESRERYYKKS